MKETQQARIIRYCQFYGSITVREAFELGINSPTKRLSELASDPKYIVTKIDEEGANRYGERTHFRRYYIRKREVEE